MIWTLVEERDKLQKDSQEVAAKHEAEIAALRAELEATKLEATKAAAARVATAATAVTQTPKTESCGDRATQPQNAPFVSVKLTVEED